MDIETVSYQLQYWSDSSEVEGWLVETISRLPEEVAEFAVENCGYMSVGKSALAMVMPVEAFHSLTDDSNGNMWLIFLDERCKKKDAHSMVAHEIAHAWLGHKRGDPNCPKTAEIDAANLTKEWGFKGVGADAEFCNRGMIIPDVEKI
jgi:hypothetical protein